MKKSLLSAVLLAVMLLSCIPAASAASTRQKEADYAAAIMQLETYLESKTHAPESLELIRATFDGLGYGQSEFFKYYAVVLIRVENNQFDTTTDLYLTMLDKGLDKALKDLPGTPIGTAQELAAYVRGRECEYQGDTVKACQYYEECMTFYDASGRYFALENERIEKTYQEAVALFDAGRYGDAQELFQAVGKYRDSGLYLDMIATELAHVWVEADCTHPRTCTHCGKTEGEPLGHDWQDATCTMPQICKRCFEGGAKKLGHDWQQDAPDAPKTCKRCGREQNRFFLGLSNCYSESDAVALCDAILRESKGKYTKENFPQTVEEAQMLFGVDYDALDCAAECVLHGVTSSESVDLKDFFPGEWGAYYSRDITYENRHGNESRDSFIELHGTIEDIIQAMGDFSRDSGAMAWFWQNQTNMLFFFQSGYMSEIELTVSPYAVQDADSPDFFPDNHQYIYFYSGYFFRYSSFFGSSNSYLQMWFSPHDYYIANYRLSNENHLTHVIIQMGK